MATEKSTSKRVPKGASVVKVQRAEYLKDPAHYASLANSRRRVYVTGESGDVVKVIGGHLNYSQRGSKSSG